MQQWFPLPLDIIAAFSKTLEAFQRARATVDARTDPPAAWHPMRLDTLAILTTL